MEKLLEIIKLNKQFNQNNSDSSASVNTTKHSLAPYMKFSKHHSKSHSNKDNTASLN